MQNSATFRLFPYSTSCLAVIFLIILFGCKKASNELQDNGLDKTVQKTVADVLFAAAPEPDLKITQLSPDKKVQRILTPVTGNESLKLFKYILIELNGEGNSFKIGKLLSKTKIDGDNNLFSLPLANDGSLNYFDVNAPENTSSKVLLKSRGAKVTFKSVADDLGDGPTSNYVVIGCGTGYCIDHWWVTYNAETGEILSIEYIGSDCYEVMCTEGGGGGGGGGGPTQPTCEQLIEVAEILANETYPESELRFITLWNTTPEIREYTYQWICLINYGGWGLLSTERGKHKRVALHGDNAWQWVSLTHVNVVKEGMTIGGSVEHSEVATPTVGIYNAGMTLAIHLVFKVACVPIVSIEKNYTSQRIFNINEGPAIPY